MKRKGDPAREAKWRQRHNDWARLATIAETLPACDHVIAACQRESLWCEHMADLWAKW